MKLKKRVKVNGMSTQILLAIMVANDAYNLKHKELVITSVVDSEHSKGSLHYVGHAVDIRTKNLSEKEAIFIAKQIRANLSNEYDVVLESNHIHIEWQPKWGL